MSTFEARFARWILNHRWLGITLCLVLVAVMAAGARNLFFDSSYRVFFSEDNPQLLAFEKLENTYTKNDNILMVLAPTDGNVFSPQALAAIEELTTAAWQIPYSNRVDSITNFQYTEAIEDDLIVRDMAKDALTLDADAINKIRAASLAEPALHKRLISDDGAVTAINVTLQMPPEERTEATPRVVKHVRAELDRFRAAHPDIAVYLTGMVMMDNAFVESAISDSSFLVPLAFALMMLLIAFLVGGLFGTLVTLFIILMSIAAAIGASGWLGFPLTSVTTSSPIVILTVAVANTVHVLVTFLHGLRQGESKLKAMEESLRVNLQPVFLASITTAIGFLTMNASEVPPFNHLGNIVAIGVVVSFILTVSFLPALLTMLPIRARATGADDYSAMSRLAEWVIRSRRQLMWGGLALVLLCVANLPRNELNDVFVHYFGESIDFRNDTDFMVDNLTGIYVVGYSLEAGESGGISNPQFLADVEAFSQWFEQQPETVHVDRFTNIMKRLNKNMHGDDAAFYQLPDNRDLAAQYLLLYEMSLPFGLDLNNQINVDKSSTKVTVTFDVISSNEMIDIDKRAHAWIKQNTSAIALAESAGTMLMFSNIGQRNIRAMLIGTTIALVLISGILIVALRSLKIGAVSLLPNLVPAAVGFGLWGIFVGEVGLSLSVVTGMTFGIVIDDTVHFLSKYLRARREQHLSPEDAVRYAFRTVGRALVVTTIVLVVGFSILATSPFSINADMGLMTAVIITVALIAVFLLLPPLLMKIEENSSDVTSDNDLADKPAAA